MRLSRAGLSDEPLGVLEIKKNDPMAHRCMWLAQQGKRVSKEAAAALLFSARASMRAADQALQIHGGWGYLTDFEVERMWRNAKLGEIGAGTNEIRQLLIARELFGMR